MRPDCVAPNTTIHERKQRDEARRLGTWTPVVSELLFECMEFYPASYGCLIWRVEPSLPKCNCPLWVGSGHWFDAMLQESELPHSAKNDSSRKLAEGCYVTPR